MNPVVSAAFALRRDFQWRRVPGYFGAQLVGATAACLVLRAMFGDVGRIGATGPGRDFSGAQAVVMEGLLTLGLVSVILGTASSAQNVGPQAAVGVGGYIVLAGLWALPVSEASMNPARALGPALVTWDFRGIWIYLLGSATGALLAVAGGYIQHGPGGRPGGRKAAQGTPDL